MNMNRDIANSPMQIPIAMPAPLITCKSSPTILYLQNSVCEESITLIITSADVILENERFYNIFVGLNIGIYFR